MRRYAFSACVAAAQAVGPLILRVAWTHNSVSSEMSRATLRPHQFVHIPSPPTPRQRRGPSPTVVLTLRRPTRGVERVRWRVPLPPLSPLALFHGRGVSLSSRRPDLLPLTGALAEVLRRLHLHLISGFFWEELIKYGNLLIDRGSCGGDIVALQVELRWFRWG